MDVRLHGATIKKVSHVFVVCIFDTINNSFYVLENVLGLKLELTYIMPLGSL